MEATVNASAEGSTCRITAFRGRVGRIGWGLILVFAVLVIIAAHSTQMAQKAVVDSLGSLIHLSPFLIASFALSAYTRAANVGALIVRVFEGRPALMIVFATLFAVLTPLCSASVIPIIAVLLRSGIPLSAVIAFWIGSPVISPDLYIYTWGILGIEMANARLITAVFMALTAGFATLVIESYGGFKSVLRPSLAIDAANIDTTERPAWRFWQDRTRREIFGREFKTAARFLVPWMLLAFIIESLISSTLSMELISRWLGASSSFAIPIAVAVGMPAYVNGVAAVPLVNGLMALGMANPAALAFIAAGSVTSVPAILAVLPIVSFRVFLWYLTLGAGTVLIAAYTYSAYLSAL